MPRPFPSGGPSCPIPGVDFTLLPAVTIRNPEMLGIFARIMGLKTGSYPAVLVEVADEVLSDPRSYARKAGWEGCKYIRY